MKNWKRKMSWEDTRLKWYSTSPNIPEPNSIRGAAMLGAFGELGRINIAIGTDKPFQFIGFHPFNKTKIRDFLGRLHFPGVSLISSSLLKLDPDYKGRNCYGFHLKFYSDDINFKPFTTGVRLFLALKKAYPELFDKSLYSELSKSKFNKVTGTKALFDAIFNGYSDEKILETANKGLEDFLQIRDKYLMY